MRPVYNTNYKIKPKQQKCFLLNQFRDGTKVSDLMTAVLKPLWKLGNPDVTKGICVAWQNLALVTVPCDNTGGFYFDFASGDDPSATTKYILGYLCETRQIQTLAGNEMCYFPFQYIGKTYTSCSFENNTLLNNNGLPWCATEVVNILFKVDYFSTYFVP